MKRIRNYIVETTISASVSSVLAQLPPGFGIGTAELFPQRESAINFRANSCCPELDQAEQVPLCRSKQGGNLGMGCG